jgi:hypothetical protein
VIGEFYHRLHAAAAAESSNKMLRVLGFHALMFGEASAQYSSPAKNKDSALGGLNHAKWNLINLPKMECVHSTKIVYCIP